MLGVQSKCRKYSFGVDLALEFVLQWPLMVVSPVRRLSANCCRLRYMRQASLRLSNEGIGSARFTKECHVKARNLVLGFGPSAITTTATLGQNFRSCGRRPIPLPPALVRHNHLHPCRNGAEAIQRLIGLTRASDRKPCGARFRVHAIGLHYRR